MQWTPIPDYPNYEILESGLVRNATTLKCLSQTPQTRGYLGLQLYRDGKPKSFMTHRLVACVFLGPPPTPTHQVNHKDGNKLNNHLSNLEWVTPKENAEHAARTGLMPSGEDNGRAKVTWEQVDWVRVYWMALTRRSAVTGKKVCKTHGMISKLANQLGISRRQLYLILDGTCWVR